MLIHHEEILTKGKVYAFPEVIGVLVDKEYSTSKSILWH